MTEKEYRDIKVGDLLYNEEKKYVVRSNSQGNCEIISDNDFKSTTEIAENSYVNLYFRDISIWHKVDENSPFYVIAKEFKILQKEFKILSEFVYKRLK